MSAQLRQQSGAAAVWQLTEGLLSHLAGPHDVESVFMGGTKASAFGALLSSANYLAQALLQASAGDPGAHP